MTLKAFEYEAGENDRQNLVKLHEFTETSLSEQQIRLALDMAYKTSVGLIIDKDIKEQDRD